MQTDITVLGGLPVTVDFEVEGADPDVGLEAGVGEWWITHINGRKVNNPQWLYKRIEGKQGEEDRILGILNQSIETYDDCEWP